MARPSFHRFRSLLSVELLEARCVPASDLITVTKLLDVEDPSDGLTSLREAITQANDTAVVESIVFSPGLAGTIQLNSNLPELSADVTIQGPGADVLTIRGFQGLGSRSIFEINGDVFLLADGPTPSIFDDGDADKLTGAEGLDWFFANLDGGMRDRITDRRATETVLELG